MLTPRRSKNEAQTLFRREDHLDEGFSITRHFNAVPQATVGHNAKTLDFLDRVDSREGVSFCGDCPPGGYMESALWSVERAISRLG